MAEKIIEIQHLKKNFGQQEVLKDIKFDIYKGEVISILGSSGSGKSTLLRCINLLEKPDDGKIFYKNENHEKQAAFPILLYVKVIQHNSESCFLNLFHN